MVRYKNRYIAVEVNPLGLSGTKSFSLNGRDLYKAVLDAVQKLHGDFGVAAISSGYSAKYCNEVTRIALLRARHGPHRILASALPTVTHVGQKSATLRTIYSGATIRHCLLFLQQYQRAALVKMWSKQRNDEERHALEAAVMDLSAVENFQLKREHHEHKATS
ncbi:hypothetical protein FOCC_FOCC012023 [Frankliniella occidentalis]|uniref:Ribonuclease P/MRP protein subunit POP5 n=1 Tax=Frankliniella occidentalis TaxID=133901 RepID=A0A6J1SJ18_FRAOC|nr:uncharacterized protein LOC113208241 [Frankliniella occidentalis]KAE8742469.1 hypothetical protein FOCC_FOCC012023 [Frankliniella occidentalis]